MFSKFKTDVEIIFLDPDVDIEPKEGKVALILSPALYWVRSFTLPVRSEKEAKKLLPSLFEDFLPEGDFRYYGYFEDERYIGFAYEEERIRSLLVQKGLELTDIEALHFAQSELSEDMLPLKINDEWMLTVIEGIVVKLPMMENVQAKTFDPKSMQLSSKAIKIEQYAVPIEKKTLYMLCAVFLGFALLYGLEWFRVEREIDQLQQRSQKLFDRYSLLPTMAQNRSVLKKYEKIDTKQKKLRKIIAALLKIPQYDKGYLQRIDVDKKSVHAVFVKLSNQTVLQKRLKGFKAEIKKLKNGATAVEVAL